MERTTIFSANRVYRYTLWREWDICNPTYVQFIGLNPSTADEKIEDPTVRRCIDFSKRWGYGALCMTNLFAFRSTDPRIMMGHPHPVGPENDRWLVAMSREAGIVVAAWGTHGEFLGRAGEVRSIIDNLQCLGTNKDGSPKHPLYLAANTILEDWV